jgi:hypothetical protein
MVSIKSTQQLEMPHRFWEKEYIATNARICASAVGIKSLIALLAVE